MNNTVNEQSTLINNIRRRRHGGGTYMQVLRGCRSLKGRFQTIHKANKPFYRMFLHKSLFSVATVCSLIPQVDKN